MLMDPEEVLHFKDGTCLIKSKILDGLWPYNFASGHYGSHFQKSSLTCLAKNVPKWYDTVFYSGSYQHKKTIPNKIQRQSQSHLSLCVARAHGVRVQNYPTCEITQEINCVNCTDCQESGLTRKWVMRTHYYWDDKLIKESNAVKHLWISPLLLQLTILPSNFELALL